MARRRRMEEVRIRAAGVVAIMESFGVLSEAAKDPATRELILADLEEFLDPDYIPRKPANICGETTRDDIMNPRRAHAGMRCAVQTGDDMQSGPIYCGKPAAVVADHAKYPAVVFSWCACHAAEHGYCAVKS